MTMRTKLMISFALLCCIGAAAVADSPTFELVTDADARVQGNNPDTNYGGTGSVGVSTSGDNGGDKSYIRFNADGIYSITGVKSISVYCTSSLGRWFNFYIIRQADGIDTWIEGNGNGDDPVNTIPDAITYNNAPANLQGVTYDPLDRRFDPNTPAGESILFLGQVGTEASAGWKTLEFDAAASAALVEALTSEDFIVTIGLESAGGTAHGLGFDSRENASGRAPYLVVEGIVDPLLPINYDPANRATVDITQQLGWDQTDDAVGLGITYEVYLGTEPNALEANYGFDLLCTQSGDGPFSCDPGLLDYDTGLLDYDTNYYWLVNTIVPGDPEPTLYEGSLLTFTTGGPLAEILTGPVRQTVPLGSTVELSVTAANATIYEWYKDGSLVEDGGKYSGALTDTLTITDVQVAEEGYYYCVVNNEIGTPDTSASARLLTQRLMGWWKFDNNDPNDSIVDLYPDAPRFGGQASGDPNYFEGIDGEAIRFYGNNRDDLVDMTGSSDFYNFYPYGYTVSAWVKAPPTPVGSTDRGAFVSKMYCWGQSTQGLHYGFALTHRGNGDAVFTQKRTFNRLVAPGAQICDNNWHLVTGTWDPSDMIGRLYVDGVRVAQSGVQTVLPPLPPSGSDPELSNVRVGAKNDITADALHWPFNGLVDDVRIYSYPLAESDVADLYYGTACQFVPDFDLSGPAGNRDCEVDIYDLAEFAAAWINPYKMGDFADLASEWLDCGLFDPGLCGN